MRTFSDIRVVGAGLIGTSIALGLKSAGYTLTIEDEDPEAEVIAQSLIGQVGEGVAPDLIVIATPISSISKLVFEYGTKYSQATLIDIGGLKSEVLAEVEKFPEISARFCATHPMAGREISGALAARGDLFEGRIWIYTPSVNATSLATERALEVIRALGASEVLLGAREHDQAIAGISHLPQIVSSLLSATLIDLSDRDIKLAGQGLKDVSRLAASNADLWSELLHANSAAVIAFLEIFSVHLDDLSTSLQNDDLRKTREIIALGNENHAPESISVAAAAMIEPAGNSLRCVEASGLTENQKLLILGSGTIGLLAAQFALAKNIEVHIAGHRESSLQLARELGVLHTHLIEDLKNNPIREFDAVIEASSDETMPALALQKVLPGGRVVLIGLSEAPSLIDTRTSVLQDLTIVGILSASPGLKGAIDYFASGSVNPEPLISEVIGFHQVADRLQGHRGVDAKPAPKIHVDPRI